MARQTQSSTTPEKKGCFQVLKPFWNIVFLAILLLLIAFNIGFSNITGETCGYLHPLIFEVEASVIDPDGRLSTAEYARFPIDEFDVNLFFDLASDFTFASDDVSQPIDPVLRIYDTDNQTLLAINDDDPQAETLDSAIRSFGLPQQQTITIEVGTFNDLDEGLYRLAVTPVSGVIDPAALAENQITQRIETIYNPDIQLDNNGDSVTGTIFSNERVIYTMTVEAGQAYDVTLEALPESALIDETELDTVVNVYTADGTILLASNDDQEQGVFSSYIQGFGVDETQTVIVEVATFQDSLAGEYFLEIFPDSGAYSTDPTAASVPNVNIITSDNMIGTGGGFVEGFINQDERIRYEFTAEGGQTYGIQVVGVNAFSDEGVALEETRAESSAATNGFSISRNASNEWPQCLQYFGNIDDGNYTLNLNGFIWFLAGTEAEDKLFETCDFEEDASLTEFLSECVRSDMRLSGEGRMFFFVLLAILVVLLPIFIVDALEGQHEIIWYIFLMLVVVQATTTAMLFLHLGQVSGIAALEEFGYGIFGGITTGAALAFIERVASRAEDQKPEIFPHDDDEENASA